ncbi:translesion DNA synthesis-associated protein ImuA [Xenophilus sp. Marseille-Q4582]|uniref:translesion DNA synthesis-associated protein ImuA n=1 Tax=Xenophilus sp. Marseille-Q4582 TaxID=2866600 RepID=UPI001CE4954B|nr:translesion DNA synthesis-associated protein ImuA [Xenophilus sp. Marseille-Q4582]
MLSHAFSGPLAGHDDLSALRERGVWRADELDAGGEAVCPTGHPALDAELPGGGWPQGALTELLQPDPPPPLWPLLLPALARTVALRPGTRVVLVAPPLPPFGPALAAGGLPSQALLCVQPDKPAERLWASEQALRCADVGAVLAWLPQARAPDLRRLQLAAAKQGGLLFILRPATQAQQASPARLRLGLELQAPGPHEGPALLSLHLLKRRGPPASQPVQVPAQGAALEALLAAAQARRRTKVASEAATAPPPAGARVLPWPPRRAASRSAAPEPTRPHALDRPALVPI